MCKVYRSIYIPTIKSLYSSAYLKLLVGYINLKKCKSLL